MVDAIESLVRAGGKRLRPALVYHSYRLCGGLDDDRVMPMAMATELLHTYLLIHDDIMDHAATRRGAPTAHVRFRRFHEGAQWPGDAAHFGRSMAILAGDLAHTWAAERFRTAIAEGVGPRTRTALDTTFAAMCEEVIHGQYLEMLLPYEADTSEADVLAVLSMKSGRYSCEQPIELGARLAGGSEELLEPLVRFGSAVGEAFQIQDDILGVFGNPERTGKPVGSDLREGKYTVLVHHTLRRSDSERRARFTKLLGRANLTEAEVHEARDIIRSSGGLDVVKAMVETRFGNAASALEDLPSEAEAYDFFAGLLDYLRDREA